MLGQFSLQESNNKDCNKDMLISSTVLEPNSVVNILSVQSSSKRSCHAYNSVDKIAYLAL